jgi:Protein of unknown function (DUF2384)
MRSRIKDKINVCLMAMLGSQELVTRWWSSPNKAFDMMTPLEVFDRHADVVYTYVTSFLA